MSLLLLYEISFLLVPGLACGFFFYYIMKFHFLSSAGIIFWWEDAALRGSRLWGWPQMVRCKTFLLQWALRRTETQIPELEQGTAECRAPDFLLCSWSLLGPPSRQHLAAHCDLHPSNVHPFHQEINRLFNSRKKMCSERLRRYFG